MLALQGVDKPIDTLAECEKGSYILTAEIRRVRHNHHSFIAFLFKMLNVRSVVPLSTKAIRLLLRKEKVQRKRTLHISSVNKSCTFDAHERFRLLKSKQFPNVFNKHLRIKAIKFYIIYGSSEIAEPYDF